MIKSSHGDTPFSLTYGTEAVIPAEIGMPTYRTTAVDVVNNDDELHLNLDMLEERRELVAMNEASTTCGTINVTKIKHHQTQSAWPHLPTIGQDPVGPLWVQIPGHGQTWHGAHPSPHTAVPPSGLAATCSPQRWPSGSPLQIPTAVKRQPAEISAHCSPEVPRTGHA
nr:reverse transcriptase domain-containing protein [Tanacetum cinerariifolium]